MRCDLFLYYFVGILVVLGSSCLVFFLFLRHGLKIPSWLFFILISFSVYMVFLGFLKLYSLHFYYDFSCWAQILNSIATVGKPLSFNEELVRSGSINYFSVHFVPLLYILALPFKIWPHGETLIIANFLIMASASIPLYKLALAEGHSRRFGLLMAVLLLWYPTFQYIVLYEFEMLRFSIPVILWMLYFWKKKRLHLYIIFAFLAVLVREEVGLTIMMFGLYLFFFEKNRSLGSLTATMGLTGFIVITQVLMPFFRDTPTYEHAAAYWFSDFGKTQLEVAKNIFLHSGLTMRTILQPLKLANLFMFFLPLLFIPLFTPAILVSTLANFGMAMLSKPVTVSSYMLYYLSSSIPFIFYAFIKGWSKFLRYLESLTLKRYLEVDLNSTAIAAVLSGLLATNILFGPSPISLQFWFKNMKPAPFKTQNFHYSAYSITDHHRKAKQFAELVPDSAVVSTQYFLFLLLFRKKGTIVYPYLENADGSVKADHVLFDKTNNGLGEESPSFKTQRDFDIIEKDKRNWKLIKSENGYFLYRRI